MAKNGRVYFWNDRVNYHKRRFDNFVKRFELKNGSLSNKNIDLYEKTLRKDKYASYSEGFLSSAVYMESSPSKHFPRANSAFKKGYQDGLEVYSKPKHKNNSYHKKNRKK